MENETYKVLSIKETQEKYLMKQLTDGIPQEQSLVAISVRANLKLKNEGWQHLFPPWLEARTGIVMALGPKARWVKV